MPAFNGVSLAVGPLSTARLSSQWRQQPRLLPLLLLLLLLCGARENSDREREREREKELKNSLVQTFLFKLRSQLFFY